MKNIHVLPTDKPSRLSILNSGKLNFGAEIMSSSNSKPQHIYITSDEEIKEGDWCLDTFNSSVYVATKVVLHNIKSLEYEKYIKKIILTTDPDLIKDGVQAIDDEFLEWFVKNPSCEEVVTERVVVYDDNNNGSGEIFHSNRKFAYEIIIPQEEKQETLEEIKLEPLYGSSYCEFSVIENQLATLYRNQEKILTAIKLLNNGKQRNT